MAITISAKTYNFDTNVTPDSAKYTGPAHTATVKDMVLLKRVAPKPTKGFNGVVRAMEKTTKSVVIDGIARDLIANTEISYAVGTPQADITALRVDHASLVGNATVTQPLVDNSKISF
jgi:hypothetical protein